jgi:hypothetical protein
LPVVAVAEHMKEQLAALAEEQTVLQAVTEIMLVAVAARSLLAALLYLAQVLRSKAALLALRATLVVLVVVVVDIGAAALARTQTPVLLAVVAPHTSTHLL